MTSRIVGALSALTLLVAACGGVVAPTTSGPETPVSAPPGTGTTPEPEPVIPKPGTLNPRPVQFDSWEQLDDDTIRVHYTTGVEPCYVLDRVELDETADSVTITLFIGSGQEGVACIEIAMLAFTDVDLAEPLGNRSVVDGSI